ncbi:MAG: tRNA preQ1(34) S-adenosylmethionine ribosyltransferase-isomerase QueA [Fimbriimonadales bacterium]
MLRLSDFDYVLPEDRIAQNPVEPRDSAKMLVVDCGEIKHRVFSDLPELLSPGDLLVLNNTRVTALRLFGERPGGGKTEVLLLRESQPLTFESLVKPAKKLKVGTSIAFEGGLEATVVGEGSDGIRTISFRSFDGFESALAAAGRVPLPPYIRETQATDERYQTVYAETPGSSAAPTAGLHFTDDLFARLTEKQIDTAFVTLDVGIDTFRPMQSENPDDHKMHGESFFIPKATRDAVANASGRVIAVGTTSVRALETASIDKRMLQPGPGCSSLFVKPGYRFKTVDAMLTNFHMPRTTMLFMVAALCGKDTLLSAYESALTADYRFLSFGDSMLILNPSTGENHA